MNRKVARRKAKRDEAEPDIVSALRLAGATVHHLDDPVDLLVGFQGINYLLEVKNPLGPKGGCSEDGQKLSESQKKFVAEWEGRDVVVVRSPEEALQAIGANPRVGTRGYRCVGCAFVMTRQINWCKFCGGEMERMGRKYR